MTEKHKTAAIIHGTECTSESFWIPWLKDKLQRDGFAVYTPSLPKHEDQFAHLDLWEKQFLRDSPSSRYDIMIGHSAGVPFILNLLSKGNINVSHALLVAGFINLLKGMTEDHPTFPKYLNHEKIKSACQKFTYIHSDNDPWGCDHLQGEALRELFGGTLIIRSGEGHFGSAYFNQPYPQFPLLYAHTKL